MSIRAQACATDGTRSGMNLACGADRPRRIEPPIDCGTSRTSCAEFLLRLTLLWLQAGARDPPCCTSLADGAIVVDAITAGHLDALCLCTLGTVSARSASMLIITFKCRRDLNAYSSAICCLTRSPRHARCYHCCLLSCMGCNLMQFLHAPQGSAGMKCMEHLIT